MLKLDHGGEPYILGADKANKGVPNEEMVFFASQNQESEGMDELERDMHSSMVLSDFLESFSDELSGLSNMEKIDVLEEANCRVL